jgi:hypothetical protein
MIDLDAANHTNRELELMVAGEKPLAMFYAETSELPDERLIPECRFAFLVSSGQFIRGETEVPGGFHEGLRRHLRIKYVFFARKGEEWRIPAMEVLLHARVKGGWNETCERMESSLLGYTPAQIDAWCRSRFRQPIPFVAGASDAL